MNKDKHKSIKKFAKIVLVVLLVVFTVPAISLLFLQNRQIQTALSEYITTKVSENLDVNISVSAVNYSFFKRIQVFDLYIEDALGDTLLYSESTRLRFKRFRPEKKDIQIHSLACYNAMFNIISYESRNNNLQYFIDEIKKDVLPEDKVVVSINKMNFTESRFRLQNPNVLPPSYGIDFSDLDIRNVDVSIKDFVLDKDTTYLRVTSASGIETSGFVLEDVEFNMEFSKSYMTFSQGYINTPGSIADVPVVDFRFTDPRNFRYLYDSINMYISLERSDLEIKDVAAFFPQIKDLQGRMFLEGSVFGMFKDMKGENIQIEYMNNSSLQFDMALIGLPNIDSLYLDFNIKDFYALPEEFSLLAPGFGKKYLNDPVFCEDIGSVAFKGSFSGYLTDFETDGALSTDLGMISFDLYMQPDSSKKLEFNGNMEADDFKVGDLLNKEDYIADIDFNIGINGSNDNGDLKLRVNGGADSLGIYGYNYSNIKLAGLFTNRTFDGAFSIRDPNIDLEFSGNVDLENKVPLLDFTLDVANLRPYYLHLRDDDPEYFASFLLKTELSGLKLEEMNGQVQLVNSLFRRNGSQVQLYNISLETENKADSSFLTINSESINAGIFGDYKIADLPHTFKHILNDHFEIFPELTPRPDSVNNFSYFVELKDADPFVEFFFPRFGIAENSSIQGSYQNTDQNFNFSLAGNLPYLEYSGYRWHDLQIEANSDSAELRLSFDGAELESKGGFSIMEPHIALNLQDNTSLLAIDWNNDSLPRYSGAFSMEGKLDNPSSDQLAFNAVIKPSSIYFNNNYFNFPRSEFSVDKNGIGFNSLIIQGEDQYIIVDGTYSETSEDSITVSLDNLNINSLNLLLNDFTSYLSGRLSGKAVFKQVLNKPIFISDLHVDSLIINKEYIGLTTLKASWIENEKHLYLDLTAEESDYNQIQMRGSYNPGNDEVDMDLDLKNMGLSSLQPYTEKVLDDLSGRGDFDIFIDGSLKKPMINGNVSISDAEFRVVPTQTVYRVTDNIRIYKNDLFFEDFTIRDSYNHNAEINGNITSSDFNNLTFNLNIAASNFNFLSTRSIDNEVFYGDIFANANINLRGPVNSLHIDASAETERYTNLKLPLYNPAEIQTTDFITFIKSKELVTEKAVEPKPPLGGMTLDMDLKIGNNASVQLIFDPKVGDIIELSGNGDLRMEIDESGNYAMFGSVLIQDGEYLFTLQNVINKKFRVLPGGSIVWNGSPTQAVIDLQAMYELKASINNLSIDRNTDLTASSNSQRRIPVRCLLTLQGDLVNPTIIPDIELPTAEPETKNLLENSIGTDEELMKQFISLLVMNNFMSSEGFGTNPEGTLGTTGVAGVTASELLSNQLSNWLSQISNDFDIGVNYRPGDKVTSDEVVLALSTQFLNDRIILSGNLDMGGTEESADPEAASNIVGDFDLEFRLSDNVSLNAFNRANDDKRLNPNPYTQGIGILYRSEFNEIGDIFSKRKNRKPKEAGKKKDPKEAVLQEED